MPAHTNQDREPRLLFVYNADSGPLRAVFDAIHKIVSPDSYSCSLCAITYGAMTMRAEWKEYVERLPHPAEFLHRDEFRLCWPEVEVALPAIMILRPGKPARLLVSQEQMTRGQTVSELIALVDQALARECGQAV